MLARTRIHTWPVDSDAPLRRARMSPDRWSILTTRTGTSSLLTYCSNGLFKKSKNKNNKAQNMKKNLQTDGRCSSLLLQVAEGVSVFALPL